MTKHKHEHNKKIPLPLTRSEGKKRYKVNTKLSEQRLTFRMIHHRAFSDEFREYKPKKLN